MRLGRSRSLHRSVSEPRGSRRLSSRGRAPGTGSRQAFDEGCSPPSLVAWAAESGIIHPVIRGARRAATLGFLTATAACLTGAAGACGPLPPTISAPAEGGPTTQAPTNAAASTTPALGSSLSRPADPAFDIAAGAAEPARPTPPPTGTTAIDPPPPASPPAAPAATASPTPDPAEPPAASAAGQVTPTDRPLAAPAADRPAETAAQPVAPDASATRPGAGTAVASSQPLGPTTPAAAFPEGRPEASATPPAAVVSAELEPSEAGAKATVLVLGLDRGGHILASGAGVVVSADNLIAASQQLVQGAAQLAVRHPDGAAGPAQLVLSDPSSGLAILRADTEPLPVAPLGSSAATQPRDPVSAFGFLSPEDSPGDQPLVTDGHLAESPPPRAPRGQAPRASAPATEIAFAAPTGPGFNGGPLFNSAGELIGVIIRPAEDAGGNGLGVAVPIDRARALISRARSGTQAADPATPIPVPGTPERTAAAEITALVEQYYADLNAGNYRASYDVLSESARRAQSFSAYLGQFRTLVEIEAGQPMVAAWSADQAIVQLQTVTVSQSGARLVRQHWQLTWYLVREGGTWRRTELDQRPLSDATPVSG